MSKYKMKINKTDLQMFLYERLEVDSYWDDLYNPKEYKIKTHNKKNNHGN